ncbi:L,D-transpeptidase family protein [Hyphomicrobium sp. B1]|uniref:L,D-transpeptidase family protein n=1 Tax=Hyphomicrobium sp. B1 TaxID=3075651 RepID=UPI003C2D5933
MRVAKVLAVGLLLTASAGSAALALDPASDQPTSDQQSTSGQSNSTDSATQPAAAPAAGSQETAPEHQPAADAAKPVPDASTAAQAPAAPATDSAAAPESKPAAEAPASEAKAPEAPAITDKPTDTAVSAPAAETPAPAADTAAAQQPTIVADDRLLYLPMEDYIQNNAKKALSGTDAADRDALAKFYHDRMGATLWVDKHGFTPEAKSLISALQGADDWGLRSADFKIPDLKANADGGFNPDDLMAAEARLSLEAMEYARDAHGDRISDPSAQLGTYIDRKPVLLDRKTVIDDLAAAPDKAAYLTSLNPQQEQFRRLREKLLALRASEKAEEALKIPSGPNMKPGQSDPAIAILRKRLKVTVPPVKADGSPADENYYDNALADAVKAYKEQKGIRPASFWITNVLRNSLNAGNGVTTDRLVANMEEWRWMPADLGNYYVMVNIPEFKFRVVSNGQVIHEERIVSGRPDAQSPIFSETMKTVVIKPRWNVPDSIKIKELLPGLRSGYDSLRRQGLVMEYNGRKVDPRNVDWSRTDIRNFHVYQPPGGGNALGVVKFLFPNKHAVYLHDTPSKSLFNEPVRAFSHGCMRVRNPVSLAELILDKDKGWDKEKVDDLVKNGPEENEIALDHPIPVHVTYFTAWVDDNGDVQTFNDIYGHEKRITLALAGKWNQIVKADEKKVSPEDIPNEGWRNDGFASLFGDDDEYDSRGRRKKHNGGLGSFFKQVFGGF